MKDIKILLVGDDTYDMYVKAFYTSFLELGYKNVKLFALNHYMKSDSAIGKLSWRVQSNIAFGPGIIRLNNLLLEYIEESTPDLVFLYTVRVIFPSTIRKIKKMGIKIFMYNNDNPFASYFPKYFWRHYRESLKYADVGFVYRKQNISDYQEKGCKHVELLRSYYMRSRNYPIKEKQLEVPKVVFLGHNEQDERASYIKALLEQGISVGVPKGGWEEFESNNPYLVKLENTHAKYNEIMNSAEIAIVFLSKINHDTYTRRCFEIPATKTLMLSVYTEDIASMFEADKEAVYFKSKDEFVDKVKYYLDHDEERERISQAGYERLIKDGHEVKNRTLQIVKKYIELSNK